MELAAALMLAVTCSAALRGIESCFGVGRVLHDGYPAALLYGEQARRTVIEIAREDHANNFRAKCRAAERNNG